MNINSYLNRILNNSDGENVVEAFVSAINVINADELVDITSEKEIVSFCPIGKIIRRCIARILQLLSQYTPNKTADILTQDEYDALVSMDSDVLYLIRRENKCFSATIDSNGRVNLLKHAVVLFDETWWNELAAYTLVKHLVSSNNGIGNIEVIVGKDFNVNEVYADQFSGSKSDHLERIRFDTPDYSISARAFKDCKDLRIVRLGSGVSSIANDAFVGCTKLTIIIDKAEGSVLGAPWGAQNATIIWNA
jgi:hypothetical protein